MKHEDAQGGIDISDRTVRRRIQLAILAALCGTLIFTSLTVNRRALSDVSSNRFWTVCQTWHERGFFRSFGLWLEWIDPAFYRRPGPPGWYAYANSSTGFLVPIYAAEEVITAVRGRPSPVVFQLYSQVVVLAGAFALALLGMRTAIRRGYDEVFAGTLGLAAAIVFQNVPHNLDRAKEIHHSTVFLTLMIVLFYLRERWSARLDARWPSIAIALLMFVMAVSDHVVNAAFLALAIGLLGFYRISSPLTLRHWLVVYLLPVVAGLLVFQLQLWLGRTVLGIQAVGSPVLLRLGFGGTGLAHAQILTFLRPPWSWWGLASLASLSLIAVLASRRRTGDEQNQRDLPPVLTPILLWICLAAVFSEMVAAHPYIFDLFLIVPSVLLVFVHAPILVGRVYRHHGLVALAVLMGAMWYVWLSLSHFARLYQGTVK